MNTSPPDSPSRLIRESNNELLKKVVGDAASAVKTEEEKQKLQAFNDLIDSTIADLEAEELLARVRSLRPDGEVTPSPSGGVKRRRRHRKTRRKKSKRKTKRKKTRRR